MTQKHGWAIATNRILLHNTPIEFASEDIVIQDNDAHETALSLGTVMSVLQTKEVLGQKWHFVEAYTPAESLTGWVKAENIALVQDKATLVNLYNSEDIKKLIVIAADFKFRFKGRKIRYSMGDKVFWKNGKIIVPLRNEEGFLELAEVDNPYNMADVLAENPLPLTTQNLIRQIEKIIGRHGRTWTWSDEDCSQVIQYIYRSFGIELGRVGRLQLIAGMRYSIDQNATKEAKEEILKNLPLGAILGIPGHVLIWLGYDKTNRPLVFHSVKAYYNAYNASELCIVRRAEVNSLEKMFKPEGKSYLEVLESVGIPFGN